MRPAPALLAPLALALLVAAPARAQGAAADSVVAAAQRAQLTGRGAAARALLASGAARAKGADLRLLYQLGVGDSHLYEGDLPAALRAYGAAAAAAGRARVDSMAGAAHHGMALAEAMGGRAREADAHLAAAERAGDWPAGNPALGRARDRAMLYALLGRVAATDSALAAFTAAAPDAARATQFVQAFRGLALAVAGRCADAARAAALAPDQQGAIVLAARAHCAAAGGRTAEAAAARTAVLTTPPSDDPFGWPYLIARQVARQLR